MKRFLALILTLSIGLLFGCTTTGTPSPSAVKTEEATPTPTATKKPRATPRPTPVMQIPFDKAMQYIWLGGSGTEVFQEHVMFIDHNDGKGPRAKLLFKTTQANILELQNIYTKKIYNGGYTYNAATGEIVLDKKTAVQSINANFLYPAESDFYKMGGGGMLYNEWLYQSNVSVTYKRTSNWTGPIPAYAGDKLPKTVAKLKSDKKLNVIWYGDSITTGCNATGTQGHFKPPFQPSFFALATEKWEKIYGADVTNKNVSVGGWSSIHAVTGANGADGMEVKLADPTDLLVIAFGVNDSGGNTSGASFKNNIKQLIDKARSVNANCEVILVSSMLSNPEWVRTKGGTDWVGDKIETEYRTALNELATEYTGVAVADVSVMHRYLLDQGKSYQDMSGNHLNHPDDYLIRIYAHTIAAMLDENAR